MSEKIVIESTPRPIVAWYIPREAPLGSEPSYVRELLVDVPLPIRSETSGIVSIHSFDVVKALTIFGRIDAADFYSQMPPERNLVLIGLEHEMVQPDQLTDILPGIDLFDQIDL